MQVPPTPGEACGSDRQLQKQPIKCNAVQQRPKIYPGDDGDRAKPRKRLGLWCFLGIEPDSGESNTAIVVPANGTRTQCTTCGDM